MRSDIIDPRIPDADKVQEARNLLRALGYCLFFNARHGWKAMSLDGLPAFTDDDLQRVVRFTGAWELDHRGAPGDTADFTVLNNAIDAALAFVV